MCTIVRVDYVAHNGVATLTVGPSQAHSKKR